VNEGVRARPDVSAVASIDKRTLYVLAWHYHDDDVAGPDAGVALTLKNLPIRSGNLKMREYRIDGEHSNAFTAWKNMGSPKVPSAAQYAELERAGRLSGDRRKPKNQRDELRSKYQPEAAAPSSRFAGSSVLIKLPLNRTPAWSAVPRHRFGKAIPFQKGYMTKR
jgi:hypothetical protein